jgi:hypothetical protein
MLMLSCISGSVAPTISRQLSPPFTPSTPTL